MVVAAVNHAKAAIDSSKNSNFQETQTHNLENLIEGPSVHDVSTFQTTLQQNMLQNVSTAADLDMESTFGVNAVGKMVMSTVDNIQGLRKKMNALAANFNNLSPQDLVELQETAEGFSITTQLLSKAISLISKDIDALVHMQ